MDTANSPYRTEDRYALALDAAGLGLIDNNPESGEIYCSPFVYELFGLNRQKRVTLDALLDRMHPDDAARTREKLAASFNPSVRAPYENEYRTLDGEGQPVRWVKAKGKSYFNEAGRLVRFIVTVQDITSEVRSRTTRQKLLTLVDNGLELMSILENDGHNSYINKAGMEMLGFDNFEQVLETPISALHEPEDIAFVEANVIPAVMGAGRWSGMMNVRHLKTGEVFPVYNNTIRIDDPVTGELLCIGAVMRDMRPEMAVQRALAESKRDLERRVAERTAELERKNRELEEYAYVTSHDLQEPLRKIRLFTEMIRERDFEHLSDPSRQKFEKITATVDRMGKALRDLLQFSGLSREELAADVDLNATVAAVAVDLELLIEQTGAQLQVTELPAVSGVPHQFQQLFYNLLSNALKFAHPGRKPVVSIEKSDAPPAYSGEPLRWICIADNGIGFTADNAEKIFTLFQRLHARHEYPGSGIGLALCRKVVQNHGGVILASATPGEGARFYIGLPASIIVSG